MRLSDAIQIVLVDRGDAPPFRAALCCGFTPLHLQTFLHAHLQQRQPHRKIQLATGLYGDLPGTLEQAAASAPDAAAVVLEWPDLDPRLGIRQLGGWHADALADIEQTVADKLHLLAAAIERLPTAVAVSGPTVPLPPVAYTAGWQASPFELRLRNLIAEFLARLAAHPGVRILSGQRLDLISPPHERLDSKAELAVDFPYSVAHACALGSLLAPLLTPAPPKKGIITDLDGTLWRGILGEVGVDGVCWSLERHAPAHGLYQQCLAALADTGALVAVASKNDAALVENVFTRTDLLLGRDRVFPFQVHWGAKSQSVREILRVWNVGADSVVFVDDSPMELAEVQNAFPEITCLEFPERDPAKVYALVCHLRDLFGKSSVSEEDRLRLASIRSSSRATADNAPAGEASDAFLAAAAPFIALDFSTQNGGGRALELVNKTNQFNLNGRRYTEAEWERQLRREDAFLLVASYQDKFGPLGKIAVVGGRRTGDCLDVEYWVMSCRAFGRRIEHQCLQQLFDRFGVAAIRFAFCPTPRNGPLATFLAGYAGAPPAEPSITRAAFEACCPKLFHTVREIVHG